jgi:hypothetical protein
LRSLFRRGRLEQELNEELQFHVERKTEAYVSKGLSPKDARHAALREFGGIEQAKENCRNTRRVNLIETLFQDLRYGTRMLRKNPGFTGVAVLTLGLGIGANTAVFSLLNALMLRALPVRDPGQLVELLHRFPGEPSVRRR